MLQTAASAFPLERYIRHGPAHAVMISAAPAEIAIPVIEKALASNPYSADFLLALMRYHAHQNDAPKAIDAFLRLREVLPTPILARVVIGLIDLKNSPP